MNRTFILAGRLSILALACIMALSSCSSDDGDGSGAVNYEQKILGTWVDGDISYRFDRGGSARYFSGDIWGSIDYNLYGCEVYMRITYHNDKTKNIWRGESKGSYNEADDTFRCDKRIYRREGKSK